MGEDIYYEIDDILSGYENTKLYSRAEDLYLSDSVELIEFNEDKAFAKFDVLSQSGNNTVYRVELHNLNSKSKFLSLCTCPYEGIICKHALAALMELAEKLEGTLGNVGMDFRQEESLSNVDIKENVTTSIDAGQAIDVFSFQNLTDYGDSGSYYLRGHIVQPDLIELEDNYVKGKFFENRTIYNTLLELNADGLLICTCNCGPRSKDRPICRHGYWLLMSLIGEWNNAFDLIFPLRNQDKLLGEELMKYGFTIEDDWEKHFSEYMGTEGYFLKPKDPGLSKISEYADWKGEIDLYIKSQVDPANIKLDNENLNQIYGILWSKFIGNLGIPGLYLIRGKRKKNGQLGAPVKNLSILPAWTSMKLPQVEEKLVNRLSSMNASKMLERFDLTYEVHAVQEKLDSAVEEMHRNIFENFKKFLYEDHFWTETVELRDTISIRSIEPIYPQEETPYFEFEFRKSTTHYLLKSFVNIGESRIPLTEVEWFSYGIIKIDKNLYVLSPGDARALQLFTEKPVYRIRHEDVSDFTRSFLLPLAEKYTVKSIGEAFNYDVVPARNNAKLYLREVDNHLVFIPAFEYLTPNGESKEVYLDGNARILFEREEDDFSLIVERDTEREGQIDHFFRNLHPAFQNQNEYYFSLPVDLVLKNNWFFSAFHEIQNKGIEVLGLKELKKIKYSPYRPIMQMRASSGTDWFDIHTEIHFGDQKVKLADIRKAIMKKQDFVKLSDGSMGMLPKEWLEKYSTIFKVGKVSKDKIQISQFQVPLIDEWVDEIDQNEVFRKLRDKIEKLKDFKKIEEVTLPDNLKAKLRNYQKLGYNWLHFLNQFGWGGCLADDMGLGKTLQVLSFLMKVSQKNPKATHLVIVPTSLVFNWLQEIDKFCPGLKTLNHTGGGRNKSSRGFGKYNIVLTTYGLVRSDIAWLKNYNFDYIVLDESQAIKNPSTQVAKAVKLLQCRNRVVMTGTPIENNTFDLYSQMDFLNPGMLGSMESFRKEFANPIDKDRNELVASQLRKMIYPFVLSRKKNEVAKELPEKTEIVVHCEMSIEQRKVYDYFKDKFRNMIMDKIESEGISKAGIYVLQGLTKLRQICNSPQLLSTEEGEFTHKSAKLEILISNLDEITSEGHKVLVFSFFTGMLDLISDELRQRKIGYVKLTGQSQNREGLVNEFKENDNKKVFLVSLKAGGFGLNLTEASYVFLVDPWWNPAVEQQAIDRTHRIGQSKQVFAYKLICRETIEEKILKIQERKLAVSQDVIHTETGFVKKLSQEDIKGLFS